MKLAVSACLLGEKVRYDGGHKRDRFITDQLSAYCSYVPFCPEALAFGTPRPSIRMVRDGEQNHIISNKDGADLTEHLLGFSNQELQKIASENLCGIIFKSKSPSCGLGSSKTYLQNGFSEGKSDGIFVSLCRKQFPHLPMEEEGRLVDDWLRENFIMQIFAYKSFENLKKNAPNMKKLVEFHTKNKFMLQAKDEKLYRELGKIVGNHESFSFNEILLSYEEKFKTAIAKKSSRKRDKNVLEHMAGFFKKELLKVEKEMLHTQIEEYMQAIVPLIVPLSTINLYAKKYNTSYLLEQTFLAPYPKELALRSSLHGSK